MRSRRRAIIIIVLSIVAFAPAFACALFDSLDVYEGGSAVRSPGLVFVHGGYSAGVTPRMEGIALFGTNAGKAHCMVVPLALADAGGLSGSSGSSCIVTRCSSTEPGPPLASAGVITITGGSLDGGFTLSPNGTNYYYVEKEVPPGYGWESDDLLTVTATGGDVPAFSVQAAAPGPLKSASCKGSPSEAGCIAYNTCEPIDRTHDLELTWTTASPFVRVTATTEGAEEKVDVSCTFSGKEGRGVIPAEALAKLQKADNVNFCGVFSVSPMGRGGPIAAGAYDVSFEIHGPGAGDYGIFVVQQ